MNVSEVIAANKGRQALARELNQRAGEDRFEVYSGTGLVSFVAERLGGAKRQAEITRPELLLLPKLDESVVSEVFRDNPDEIQVCGRNASVRYGDRSNPVVYIDFRGEQAKDWLQLPAEGVRLPGGREVALYSAVDGYGYYIEALSSKFPAKARECLNSGMWQSFERSLEKPAIVLPDPMVENSEVPAVREHQYGACAVTGEALLAFGTVTVKGYRYSTDPYFEGKWFQDRQSAEAAHAQSVEKLSALKRELAEQKVVAEAREKAEAVKAEALRLYRSHSNVVGRELMGQLYQLSYVYLPQDLDGLRRWMEGATAVLVEAKRMVAEDQACRNRLEGTRPKQPVQQPPLAPRQREREVKRPTPKVVCGFGLGADAWGALDDLKLD